ncbi:hypothetical protein EVB55_171 [Rhizobium phage RHph_Y68]|uniref:Uncharacterized protein n=1 Tax=Rhizobium phage RHph_Y68 TaxID=2509787 RepID=A0A7S5UTB5_9CAUD|nr:hypothetical protein PP934_gp171 [Rhizobium phage RHph_Y68]QIG68106.1 hypothetical protein EVB55_171 [Rhizobium phage RHph_Y68]
MTTLACIYIGYCVYSITHYVAFVEDVPNASLWDKFWSFPTMVVVESARKFVQN